MWKWSLREVVDSFLLLHFQPQLLYIEKLHFLDYVPVLRCFEFARQDSHSNLYTTNTLVELKICFSFCSSCILKTVTASFNAVCFFKEVLVLNPNLF